MHASEKEEGDDQPSLSKVFIDNPANYIKIWTHQGFITYNRVRPEVLEEYVQKRIAAEDLAALLEQEKEKNIIVVEQLEEQLQDNTMQLSNALSKALKKNDDFEEENARLKAQLTAQLEQERG